MPRSNRFKRQDDTKSTPLNLIWRGRKIAVRDWNMVGFSVRRLPFRKLILGAEEDIQIEFVSDGLEVRFPALISITKINQRHQQVACRFVMIDPRGERLMMQAQIAAGKATASDPPAADTATPPILDEGTVDKQAGARRMATAPHVPQDTSGATTADPSTAKHTNLNLAPAPGEPSNQEPQHRGHNDRNITFRNTLSNDRFGEFEDDDDFINPLVITYRALRDRWAQAAVVFMVAATVLAALAWIVIDPIFQSRGLIRIAAKEPKILYAERDDSRLRLFDAFVSSELTYLTSRPVLDRALYLMGQQQELPRDVAETVDQLEQRLNARKLQSLLELTADAKNPEAAKVMVNAVLDAYQQMHVEQLDQRQTIRERELIAREQELLTRLDQQYARLLDVGGEHDVNTLRATHKLRLEQIEEARSAISELEGSLKQLEDSGKIIGDGSVDTAIQRAVMQDRTLADLTFERTKRAATLSTLQERYVDSHPSVQFAKQELAIMDEAIDNRYDLINRLGESGALSSGANGDQQSTDELREMRGLQQARLTTLRTEAEQLNAKLIDVTAIDDDISENRTML
ncbi:MAG: hypothetical protein AAF556_07070, partial [Pseudomonadota bacterium]